MKESQFPYKVLVKINHVRTRSDLYFSPVTWRFCQSTIYCFGSSLVLAPVLQDVPLRRGNFLVVSILSSAWEIQRLDSSFALLFRGLSSEIGIGLFLRFRELMLRVSHSALRHWLIVPPLWVQNTVQLN